MQNELQIESYHVELPLERLKLGIDNLRYDVLLSPEFISNGGQLIFQSIVRHADASGILDPDQSWNHHLETNRFKTACKELMANAVHQAKSTREIQVDYLAQVAIAKWIMQEIGIQYEKLVQNFKNVIRKQEITGRVDSQIKSREEISGIVQRRIEILHSVSNELFTYFMDARREVNELRILNFGDDHLLPEELFDNPLLKTTFRPDDFFMMEHYVLLGHRVEDPLNYSSISAAIQAYFDTLGIGRNKSGSNPSAGSSDHFIKHTGNIDYLFNYPETESLVREERRTRTNSKIHALKKVAGQQKRRLARLSRMLSRKKMLAGIVAAYRINQTVYTYCPPLKPQEVLQYIVTPKARKSILRKLERSKKYSEKSISPVALKRIAFRLRWLSSRQKKTYLIRFLNDFARYHRDLGNYHLFRKTVDCIHLVDKNRLVKLSRENHTLYEFILPWEKRNSKSVIINHAIIKADVRGSTEIIAQMKEKGLNPATNFSLNFFDPIRRMLSVYNANKVFIEGDAIILSILENAGEPHRWYGVARACGLAVNMLMIVKRYNMKNKKNCLPRLDLGIGIGYSESAPTFFYDDKHPVMISPAINQADRLSKCDRALRQRLARNHSPFHLHVYEIDTSAMDTAELLNSSILRYNVMGIELCPAGFEKLSREIHLKPFKARIPKFQDTPFSAYTGKFPVASGEYQRIIIREQEIFLVSPRDLSIVGQTGRKYYEILTRPEIYDYVKKMK